MMHYKVLAVLVLICAVQKSHATETPPPACSGGSVQCCNSVQSATSPDALKAIAGLIGVVVGTITGQVGLQCTPITGIGAGGQSCTTQAACCTGNNFNGLVVVGCSPINING